MPITICSHKNVAISCKPQNFECLCTLLKNAQPYMTVLTYNISSHSLTLGSHDLSEFFNSWLASIDWSFKLNIFSISNTVARRQHKAVQLLFMSPPYFPLIKFLLH